MRHFYLLILILYSSTSYSQASKEYCSFEGENYVENSQVVIHNKMLYCRRNSSGYLNFIIKLDELIKKEKEIIFGYNHCMYNNREYLNGSTIKDGRFLLECITIGYDYNGDKIYSFEIPGAESVIFNNRELLEMGLPNDYSVIDELLISD